MHPLPPPSRRGTSDRLLETHPAADGAAVCFNGSSTGDGAAADAADDDSGPAIVDGQFDDASEDELQQSPSLKTGAPSKEGAQPQLSTLEKQQQPESQQAQQRGKHSICNSQVNASNSNNNFIMGTTMVVSPRTNAYVPFFFPVMMMPLPHPAIVHQQQQRNQQTRALIPLAPKPTPVRPKKSVRQSNKTSSRKKQQPQKKKQNVQPKSKLPRKHRANTKVDASAGDQQHMEKGDLKRKEETAYGTILVDRCIQQKKIDIGESPFYKIIADHPSDIIVPFSNIDPSKRLAETTVEPDEGKQNPILVNNLTSADILLGRGGLSNNHEGNLWFRDLVSHYRTAYHQSAKGQKKLLAQNLCLYVRQSGGRFLEKDDTRYSSAVCFFECGDGRAQAKCAQALREVGTPERCSSSNSRKVRVAAAASSSTSQSPEAPAPAPAANNKSPKENKQSENKEREKSCKNIPAAATPTAKARGGDKPDSIPSDDLPSAATKQNHDGKRNRILTCSAPEPPIDSPGEAEPGSQVLDASGDTKKRKKRRGSTLSPPGDQHRHHHVTGDKQDGKRLRTATFAKAWSIYDTSSY